MTNIGSVETGRVSSLGETPSGGVEAEMPISRDSDVSLTRDERQEVFENQNRQEE